MYELTKALGKKLIPSSTLKKHKGKARKIIGWAYKGSQFQCNICKTGLRKFVAIDTNELLCPCCGSLRRTRGLWKLVKDKIKNKTVLHFSPSSSIKAAIEKDRSVKKYLTSDYEDEFEAEHQFDIKNLQLEDNSIDIIICYHILEHIPNDTKAIEELFRVLKDDGSCYVQTPFKQGDIYEDDNIVNPEERLKHFGQRDHVRIYSVEGLAERLSNTGFMTEIVENKNEPSNYNGLKTKDLTILSRKSH